MKSHLLQEMGRHGAADVSFCDQGIAADYPRGTPRGRAEREVDLMRVSEEIEDLGFRPSRLRFSGYPRYQELLAHSLKTIDWDPEEFRAYRLHMAYPLHGTQMCMGIYPAGR